MLRKALCLFLPFLLTGCVTMTHPRISRPDEGAVILRVTANAYTTNRASGAWRDIELRRIDAQATAFTPNVLTLPQPQEYVQSYVYGGALKAGRYAIQKMTFHSGSFIEPAPSLGYFDVKPGQITYLGHLIQLNDASYKGVLLAHPVGLTDSREAGAIVKDTFPALAPLLGNSVLGWASTSQFEFFKPEATAKLSRADELMKMRYDHVRAHADGSLSPLELANGDVLFGTLLGTLRRWHPGGTVGLVDLHTTNAVAAIAELRNGTLLAGGEFSFLKSSDDGGQFWQEVPNNLPAGIITDLKELPDGRLHVTLLHHAEVLTYAGTLGNPKWTRLSATPPVGYDTDNLPPRTFLHEGIATTLLPPARLLAYDTRAGTQQILALPGAAREFTQAANGWMYCLCARSFVASNYVSKDLGRSWQPIRSNMMLGMPRFRDERNGVAVERPLLGPPHLMETRDGGVTWNARAFMNNPGVLLGYLRDGNTLLVESYGDVYASQDTGDNWVPIKRLK